ncbi:MAG: DEAD/DEAH box helicase [Propionibacteriaceae bacterium]|nr:DEAD/DEAH box helicase [Propionibacteriaceae bacterium]
MQLDQTFDIVASLTDAHILVAVSHDRGAFNRGLGYFRQGRVKNISWDPARSQVQGRVRGSRANPYTTTAAIAVRDGRLAITGSQCTCPMFMDCKHVVALLMAARVLASASIEAAVPQWRQQLTTLMPAQKSADRHQPPDGYAPLALQFRVDGITMAVSQPTLFSSASQLSVSIRPVCQEKPGKWASSYRLTWRGTATYASYSSQVFDPAKVEWLSNLSSLNSEIGYYFYGAETRWQKLDGFADIGLWPLLQTGRLLGVPFVGTSAKDEVRLAHRSALQANITRIGDDLSLERFVTFDDQPTSATLLGAVGHGGIFAVEVGRSGRVLTLAQAEPRLTDDHLRLLTLSGVTVPADDVDDFMGQFYPLLRRRLRVTSTDGSVDLPTPPRPILVGRVWADSAWQVEVAWTWRYGQVTYPFVDDSLGATPRDDLVERIILTSVELAVADMPGFAGFQLGQVSRFVGGGGLQARAFSETVLPLLQEHPDVEIVIDDPLPEYRDIAETASISLSTSDSGDNDWFDLGVKITAGGIVLPFQDVFLALAAGQQQMVLAGGEVVRIDDPVLTRLRDLIDEARALSDQPTGPLRISRYQTGLWSDLTEVADDVLQADAWRESVSDLIELVNRGEGVSPIELPAGLTVQMRPYQHHAFEWLTFLDTHRLGGILADDMGLGKTVEVLAWIAGVVERRGGGDDHGIVRGPDGTPSPFMVVAPASVVGNWVTEAGRFTPSLRVVALTETLGKSSTLLDDVVRDADVIVMSYAIFRLDNDELAKITWQGLILDEAQFVKNARSVGNKLARSLRARVKLAVTGTPLENDVMELWALLSIVAPGFGGSAKSFKEVYGTPITKAATTRQRRRIAAATRSTPRNFRAYDAMQVSADEEEVMKLGDQRLSQLRRRLRPLMLRRTKELVAPELPSRQEQILEVGLSTRHRTIYDTYLQRERQRVLGLLDDLDRNRFAILRSLTILRRLALDASLIEPVKYAGVPSAKLDTLIEQVEEVVASGHRALVFSQFTTFLAKATQRLDKAGIDYTYLDGHTRSRDKVISRFRNEDIPVFCLSLKAGGFGLTLTEADYVFLLDPWWNPATEQQAIDRTHRIGQTRGVMVVRLVSEGTIEEKVMALQARKREVFKAVLADDDAEASFASSLSAEDIRGLLLE